MSPLERLDFLREARTVLDCQIAELEVTVGVRKPRRRSRNVVPACGSETAFQRHHHRGEMIDTACRIAHAAYERARVS